MKQFFSIAFLLMFVVFTEQSQTFAQQLFHQDVFYGGVTSAGWSHGEGASGSGTIALNIPSGSTIKNAWLFMFRLGKPEPGFFTINNTTIYHEDLIKINEVFHFDMGPVDFYYIDFKDFITTGANTLNVQTYFETAGPELNWQWCNPIIYVEYENENLDKISTSLWYNDQDFRGLEEYEFFGMNPIDTNNDVGLSLMLDRACSNPIDRTYVWVNDNMLTTWEAGVGGNNSNSTQSCAGVRGHFYYENGTLVGFDNAIANNTMDDNDALAEITPYINNNDTGYELRLRHYQWPPPVVPVAPNILTLIPHAYTTPCDTFSTAVAFTDTTVCRGESVEISVSGGNSYTWLDSTFSAPSNPIQTVSPDSTKTYIVKIENEPGCFRTEQVLVKVNQPPNITNVSITPTVCGEETGHIGASATGFSPFISSIGAGDQNQAQFPNLASGDYTLTITDQNGCSSDTLVNVPDSIAVQTSFIADPPGGPEPLSVLFNNTSENATDYEWFINNDFWDDDFNSGALFDSSGVFEVSLVAYNNVPHCADTFTVFIHVKDTLIVQFPNVFTPNNDQVNDVFTVKIRGGTHLEGGIFNRWGNEMVALNQSLTPQAQTIPLWDGFSNDQPATEGVYFYRFVIKDVDGKENTFQGYLHLNR